MAVLADQCLDRCIPNLDTLREEITTWQRQHNQYQTKIHWQFSTDVVWVKLKRLYPSIEPAEDPMESEISNSVKICAAAH